MTKAYNKTYHAAAAANVIVATGKAILHGIIIGKDVASSTIEVSDSALDGDGNVKIFLDGSALMTAVGGYLEVGAVFDNGITADIVNQAQVTFIWEPTA